MNTCCVCKRTMLCAPAAVTDKGKICTACDTDAELALAPLSPYEEPKNLPPFVNDLTWIGESIKQSFK